MKHKILCLFLMLGFSVQAQAATLSFVLSDSNVELGESVRVDLVIDGLGDDILTGFDVSIFFDENTVGFESFDFGTGLDVLGLGSLQGVTSLGPGEVEVFELSFDLDEDTMRLQAENFILGTFKFTGLRSGISALDILVWELAGAYVF